MYYIRTNEMTKEEEMNCFEELKVVRRLEDTEKIEELENRIISANCKLISHIIKGISNNKLPKDDMYSIGARGMLKAIRTFDIDRCFKFSTYAIKCIKNEIFMEFRRLKSRAEEISINTPYGFDKDGNALKFEDSVESDEDLGLEIVDRDKKYRLKNLIINSKMLDNREKFVLLARTGICGKLLTQREIAKKLNISRSYISRIQNSAVRKIKIEVKINGLAKD